MSEQEDSGLLAIEVDADDYAEIAADDTPPVPRTYQSEADFQAIKAAYSAKIDGVTGHSTYNNLIAAVPALGVGGGKAANGQGIGDDGKVKLGKKDAQLLGYVIGEMYFDRRYREVVGLCARVKERCEIDAKTAESLERWTCRCMGGKGTMHEETNHREAFGPPNP